MALELLLSQHNPDVLSCLANLSSDEVFTPPSVVNQMLDMLPQELFCNPDTTFLDPGTKSGVFLREIAKRLIAGLENQIPDLDERVDHIFKKQLFGIATTQLTSLLARRSLYCSKYPNSNFSVVKFDDPEGNIRFRKVKHRWQDGKCYYCGAGKSEYDRGDEDIQSLFLHKCIDDLRNNKGRRTVSNRHQNAAQGPVFDLRCAVELYKYDKREQIHADYQNIHTLDRFFIPEDRDPERYRKHRQNQYQRPVLKQIFFYHEISFHNNVISLLYC